MLTLLTLLAASSIMPATAQAKWWRIPVGADTHVMKAVPGRAHGASQHLVVDGRRGATAYLDFQVRACPNGVESARLKLRVAGTATAGTRNGPRVYEASRRISEPRTSWRNRPRSLGWDIANAGRLARRGVVSYNVSEMVLDSGWKSFALVADSGDDTRFLSGESAFAPMLVVNCFPAEDDDTRQEGVGATPIDDGTTNDVWDDDESEEDTGGDTGTGGGGDDVADEWDTGEEVA